MWISENERSKFWMQVLTEIKTRGVKDIYIASVLVFKYKNRKTSF